jgi:dipeptide/tripeptide permease
MADTHWGRWKTIFIASILAIIGHILLVVSSLPRVLEAPNSSMAVLLIGIVIMGLGTGAIKANVRRVPTLVQEAVSTADRVQYSHGRANGPSQAQDQGVQDW